MTVAEMKISNRERLNKLEALDPEKLNDILDYVFSKLVSMPNEEERNQSLTFLKFKIKKSCLLILEFGKTMETKLKN